jgi:hypothetical protein
MKYREVHHIELSILVDVRCVQSASLLVEVEHEFEILRKHLFRDLLLPLESVPVENVFVTLRAVAGSAGPYTWLLMMSGPPLLSGII